MCLLRDYVNVIVSGEYSAVVRPGGKLSRVLLLNAHLVDVSLVAALLATSGWSLSSSSAVLA
jgi:hypothetical protein